MLNKKMLLVWNEAYSKALFQRLSEQKSEQAAREAARREIDRARAEEIAQQENGVNVKGGRS